jgi:hypothetical protein
MDEELSAVATNIHRRLFDDIEFSKRQQWAVTNYVVLVYAALFYLSGRFPAHITCAKMALSFLAFVAGAYAAFMLIKMQCDMGKYRTRLVRAHTAWLTGNERATLKPDDYNGRPGLRGIEFLIGLLGVDLIGLFLLIGVIWFGTATSALK